MKNKSRLLIDLSNFMVVATFFSLWLAVQFGELVENIVAYVLILSLGILHGANDLELIKHSDSSVVTAKSYIKTLVYYVIFVLGSALLFYAIPSLALLFFVIFSGYHFGEQHFTSKMNKVTLRSSIFFLVYGLFILSLLFYLHAETVTNVIYTITEIELSERSYFLMMLVSGFLMIGLYLFLARKHKQLRTIAIREVFHILVFFVLFSTASLLWSFAIYFVLWHSIPSLVDQIYYLYGDFSRGTIISYTKASFPYWMVSIIGIAFLLYIFSANFETSLSFFFSFLAAITFPHVLVINRMKNS